MLICGQHNLILDSPYFWSQHLNYEKFYVVLLVVIINIRKILEQLKIPLRSCIELTYISGCICICKTVVHKCT